MIVAFVFIPSVYFRPNLHSEKRNSTEREKIEEDLKRLSDAMSVYRESVETNTEKIKILEDLKILLRNYVLNTINLDFFVQCFDLGHPLLYNYSYSVLGIRLFKNSTPNRRVLCFDCLYV